MKIKESGVNNYAAIAGKLSAEMYQMKMLAENIQNDINNMTRFFVIGKTSLVIGLRGDLGSLRECIGFFTERDIKIERIESRASRVRPFEYLIYLDFLGDGDDIRVAQALRDLLHECQFAREIGSYQAAELPERTPDDLKRACLELGCLRVRPR
ncbi:MAG: prephenate dehydratase domain-containing protein [Conexivisphaerales archaeon]